MATPTLSNLTLLARHADEPWPIAQKLFLILSAYLQLPSKTPAVHAAQKINQLFPLVRPVEGDTLNETPESFLWEMWEVLVDVASQIPWDHPAQDKLVEFLKSLRDLPYPMTVDMEEWGEVQLWTDLPILGPVLTETSYNTNAADQKTAQSERARNLNLEALRARLTRDEIQDCSSNGIYALREALEQEPDYRSRAYHMQGPQLELYVPIASVWIQVAGAALFRHARSLGEEADEGCADIGGGRTWKGKNGFSLARWEYWKDRFTQVKVHDQASEITREFAAKAEEVMVAIEAEI